MIFVTVGNMDPFDRLIQAIDQWLGEKPGTEEVVAQIGKGTYRPRNCNHVQFLTPQQYRETFAQARFVVSHAGMGTIITALELQKPIVVMPKLASLGEQRNEHQLATVRHFCRSKQVIVAESEKDLGRVLNEVLASGLSNGPAGNAATDATNWIPDSNLINFVRNFVLQPTA